ncbi:MAG: TonB-dependent receptor [Chitinophagaceae bacterium]|nr:TonB-dependent receptor [Bacteroidota bacterium]MCC6257513.1 TonB-dependent receptor [Chitinophagaceae bacterium]MCW5916253.1 TonB-dependent receptor [Ferruginibacter sp.]
MRHLILTTLLLLFSVLVFCQTQKGNVINANGAPVPKATIHLLNSDIYLSADNNGKFEIGGLNRDAILEFSAVGYASMLLKPDTVKNRELTIVLPFRHRDLGQVVVSAEKTEGTNLKKPLSITVINGEKIAFQNLGSQDELTAMVSNLYIANSGDGRNVASIRGIGTTSYDPAVATYIDGVNQFSLDTYISPLWDIERIEILRGPQGTLYGRNALGAVISIRTRQPANAWQSNLSLSAGNYHRLHLQAATRGALVKNRLFAGVSLLGQSDDGFYTNDFNHKNFDDIKGFAGNYYLKYISPKQLSITLNYKQYNKKNYGAFPLVQGKEEALASPFHLSQNATAVMHDNTQNLSLVIKKTFKSVKLVSQSAYQQNYRYYDAPLDGDFSPADMVTIINNYGRKWNNVKVFTQELRASGNAKDNKINWTAGGFFFYQHNPVKQMTHFGEDAGLMGAPDINFGSLATTKNYGHGIAFFGQFNYQVSKTITAFAGLRFDDEHKYSDVKGEYFKDGITDPLFETRPDTSASANFEAWSPKVGISFSPDSKNSGYLIYSKGFRAGGLTGLNPDPSTPPLYQYKPEFSHNLELGWKYNSQKLAVHAALYYTSLRDAQVPTLILPEAVTVTRNTGKLNVKGFDLEVNAIPIKNLELEGSLGLADSKFNNLKYASNGTTLNLDGKRQVFSPTWTGFTGALYSIPFSSQWEINLGIQFRYVGKQYFDFANTISQSDYSLLSSQVGISYKSLSFRIWGKNLGQKRYIAYAYDFGAVHLGDPRTYGITLAARF